MSQNNNSDLVKSIARFANCISGAGMLYLSPKIAAHVRPEMYNYFAAEFGSDMGELGSWAFVIALILGGFFGASMLSLLLINSFVRKGSTKGIW